MLLDCLQLLGPTMEMPPQGASTGARVRGVLVAEKEDGGKFPALRKGIIWATTKEKQMSQR